MPERITNIFHSEDLMYNGITNEQDFILCKVTFCTKPGIYQFIYIYIPIHMMLEICEIGYLTAIMLCVGKIYIQIAEININHFFANFSCSKCLEILHLYF